MRGTRARQRIPLSPANKNPGGPDARVFTWGYGGEAS
jgi:hypothetical protein